MHCITFSADGTRVAVRFANQPVRVLLVSDGVELCSISSYGGVSSDVALKTDGTFVAFDAECAGPDYRGRYKVGDTAQGAVLLLQTRHAARAARRAPLAVLLQLTSCHARG